MNTNKPTTSGTFTWVDLATRDISAIKGFYGELMGWSFKDKTNNKAYTLALKSEQPVCGIYEIEKGAVPPHWMSYISVDDINSTINQAKTLGAVVRKGPLQIGDMGTMAILRDPSDAYVALWQGKQKAEKTAMSNQAGTFCWVELATKDTKKAEDFYTKLFGWTAKRDEKMSSYTMFYKNETMVGGMMAAKENMPPHWLVYFSVDDCDKRTEQVKRFQGKVIMDPQDIPDVGRFSIVTDPQGAHFGMIKLN